MLQDCFQQLLSQYTTDTHHTGKLWEEVETHYAASHRYYHTLDHLAYMYQHLLACKEQIEDWDTVLFSLFYHDIIYNPLAKDNEEQSAALAAQRLQDLSYPDHKIARCHAQIVATKQHQLQEDADANHLIDADLAILGSNAAMYTQYAVNVRKEYAVYPDFLYKPGRAKVLQHFLQMERIFKTSYFFEQFETSARQNLAAELQQLS